MRDAIERLIDDYERRILSTELILDKDATRESQWHRVAGKSQAYRHFVRDLKAVLAEHEANRTD